MKKAGVPRMAFISSIGMGDSKAQLWRSGIGGWLYAAIFATVLRQLVESGAVSLCGHSPIAHHGHLEAWAATKHSGARSRQAWGLVWS